MAIKETLLLRVMISSCFPNCFSHDKTITVEFVLLLSVQQQIVLVSGICINTFFLFVCKMISFFHFLFIIPKRKTTFMLVPWCSKITSNEPNILGFSKYPSDSGSLDMQNLLQGEMNVTLWFLLVLLLKFNIFVQSLPWENWMKIKY